MPWMCHQSRPKLPKDVQVSLGEGGELQGDKGLLLGGVGVSEDNSAGPFLYSLQLTLLGEREGRGPGW